MSSPQQPRHHRNRIAKTHPAMVVTGVSIVVIGALVAMLYWPSKPPAQFTNPNGQPIMLYCAAGIKPPVLKIVRNYEKEYGVQVQIQFGGSGEMLSNIQAYKTGDLFLSADPDHIDTARAKGLLAEVIPLARQTPVLAVRKGNPRNIRTIDDMLRPDVKLSMANESAAIGALVKQKLTRAGKWSEMEKRVRSNGVFKPTVTHCATDVKIGAADASILWDATVKMFPDLEAVGGPIFADTTQPVSVAVLNSTQAPTAALRLARYIASSDKGLPTFASMGFEVEEGDPWAVTPTLLLHSGSMLRPAIEKTLKEFQVREGVQINTVYNGCGVLTAQMKAGERPDAYFSCDTTFMDTVADLYISPLTISDNPIRIIVPKGNPKKIKTVDDLARPGLKVGVASPEKSAMGALSKNMLIAMGKYDAVKRNVEVETPTGDMLVNQLRTGSLDAIIACQSNAKSGAEFLEPIEIPHPLAMAAQPYAVAKSTKYKRLLTRLLDQFTAAQSKERFLKSGFGWKLPQ